MLPNSERTRSRHATPPRLLALLLSWLMPMGAVPNARAGTGAHVAPAATARPSTLQRSEIPSKATEAASLAAGSSGSETSDASSAGTSRVTAVEPEPLPIPVHHHCGAGVRDCSELFYEAEHFTRGFGADTTRTVDVDLPAGLEPPFVLHVANGDAYGWSRVLFGAIRIDGVLVASGSDFDPHSRGFDKIVALSSHSRVEVRLGGRPDSFVRVGLCGRPPDEQAPTVALLEPANGSVTSDPTPALRMTYADDRGVVPSSVRLYHALEGGTETDVTSYLSVGATEATGVFPDALPDGVHRLRGAVADAAGHTPPDAATTFTIDATPPVVSIEEPSGSYVTTDELRVGVKVTDLTSVSVEVNGVLAVRQDDLYVATVPCGDDATFTATAVATDAAGNTGSDSRTYRVDKAHLTIDIDVPSPDTLTRDGVVAVSGRVLTGSPVAVSVGSAPALVSGSASPYSFSSAIGLSEGSNAVRPGHEQCRSFQRARTVTIRRDSTPPTVSLGVPERVDLGATFDASATVEDAGEIVRSRLSSTEPPWNADGPSVDVRVSRSPETLRPAVRSS